jgi:hypothetical protein
MQTRRDRRLPLESEHRVPASRGAHGRGPALRRYRPQVVVCSWPPPGKQSGFQMRQEPVSRLVLPPEADPSVLVFERVQ